jgi:hypothetical protein
MTGSSLEAALTPNNRTYKKNIERGYEIRKFSEAEIRLSKNKRSKQRGDKRRQDKADISNRRCEAWRTLTPQQQLENLDLRLGKGIGATKQRARIQDLIDNPPKKVEPLNKDTVVTINHGGKNPYNKKHKRFNKNI